MKEMEKFWIKHYWEMDKKHCQRKTKDWWQGKLGLIGREAKIFLASKTKKRSKN